MKNLNLLIVVLFAIACDYDYKEYKEKDPYHESSYAHGRLLLIDEIGNTEPKPLAKKTVKAFYEDATDIEGNYVSSALTDEEGYFRFDNLSTRSKYKLIYSEIIDGKAYLGEKKQLTLPQETVPLEAKLDTKQTGIIFKVTDSNGAVLNGVDVCLAVGDHIWLTESCDVNNYSLKTDANGKASIFGLPQGVYYIFAKTTLNNVICLKKDTVKVAGFFGAPKELKLSPKPTTSPTNVLNIVAIDINEQKIANVNICLFSSRTVFRADTCSASSYSSKSNVEGNASFSNLVPGKYYILAELYLKDRRISSRDSIEIVNRSQAYETTLKLN